jgi:uncharacterized phage-like protein YoqJ
MIVAFTGHRPQHLSLPQREFAKTEISRVLRRLQPEAVISGMAPGVDIWAVEAALSLGIPFDAYVPFPGQESRWSPEVRKRYFELLGYARTKRIVSPEFTRTAFQDRNVAMVDDCDVVIAVWNGKRSGGTYNCLKYARSVEKALLVIHLTQQRSFWERPRSLDTPLPFPEDHQ